MLLCIVINFAYRREFNYNRNRKEEQNMYKILFTGGKDIFTKEELEEINKSGLEITIAPPHVEEQELINSL